MPTGVCQQTVDVPFAKCDLCYVVVEDVRRVERRGVARHEDRSGNGMTEINVLDRSDSTGELVLKQRIVCDGCMSKHGEYPMALVVRKRVMGGEV